MKIKALASVTVLFAKVYPCESQFWTPVWTPVMGVRRATQGIKILGISKVPKQGKGYTFLIKNCDRIGLKVSYILRPFRVKFLTSFLFSRG